ncbi:response regulator [Mariprofundus ferrooxydans]|uniref:ATP-binding response regulator n=1 Tax=Mariprofundus ferrooxydans TaxID=314344 RepID=UPI0038B38303
MLNLITNVNEAIGEKSGVISFGSGVMHADVAYLNSSLICDQLKRGRYVYPEVSGTGCGMDAVTSEKDIRSFLYNQIYRSGLGMSAVLDIVRGHHGALRMYSEPGEGATFNMLLQALESVAVVSDTVDDVTHADDARFGEGVILVVDDEETIREIATMMLGDMGFGTLTAIDGRDAVDVYRQHAADIVAVLLDMTMPKMDGSECFRELRRINPGVKVVLSSGYNEEEATSRFTDKGLAGFLQKPYSPDRLREIMAGILT